MPTAAHFIYIPAMLMLGVVLGFFFGSRATRDAIAAEQARKEARTARRARAAAAKDEAAPPSPPDEAAP
jgi:hypothetical protein